jgi:hypothetical protein
MLQDNLRLHTAAVTAGTLEEVHWEVLPHLACNPDLVPSDFHLFGPVKEALGGKMSGANDEVTLLVQRCLNEETQTFLEGTLRSCSSYDDGV